MFAKLATDITFSDVKDFCRKFGEGVRVEYKREIQHIPKTVSAFANTQGGVITSRVTHPHLRLLTRNGVCSPASTATQCTEPNRT